MEQSLSLLSHPCVLSTDGNLRLHLCPDSPASIRAEASPCFLFLSSVRSNQSATLPRPSSTCCCVCCQTAAVWRVTQCQETQTGIRQSHTELEVTHRYDCQEEFSSGSHMTNPAPTSGLVQSTASEACRLCKNHFMAQLFRQGTAEHSAQRRPLALV